MRAVSDLVGVTIGGFAGFFVLLGIGLMRISIGLVTFGLCMVMAAYTGLGLFCIAGTFLLPHVHSKLATGFGYLGYAAAACAAAAMLQFVMGTFFDSNAKKARPQDISTLRRS